jgi:hypothetical protein
VWGHLLSVGFIPQRGTIDVDSLRGALDGQTFLGLTGGTTSLPHLSQNPSTSGSGLRADSRRLGFL